MGGWVRASVRSCVTSHLNGKPSVLDEKHPIHVQ